MANPGEAREASAGPMFQVLAEMQRCRIIAFRQSRGGCGGPREYRAWPSGCIAASEIIFRAGVGARALHLLQLKPGEWVEWVPSASKPASWPERHRRDLDGPSNRACPPSGGAFTNDRIPAAQHSRLAANVRPPV